MRCTLAGTVGTWLLAGAALTAADFWQEKDFTVWSAQQVEKMLTDSPWAKRVTVVVGSVREEALGGFQPGDSSPGGGAICLSTDCGAPGTEPAANRDASVSSAELTTAGFNSLWPAYVTGQAYLQMGEGEMAAAEFRKLLDHPGIVG